MVSIKSIMKISVGITDNEVTSKINHIRMIVLTASSNILQLLHYYITSTRGCLKLICFDYVYHTYFYNSMYKRVYTPPT